MESRKLKGVEDIDDFNCAASEVFERFLQGFTVESGLLRKITADDEAEEEWDFIYTNKGIKLAERMLGRLRRVGQHYFPNEEFDIEIESSYYQEN